MTAQDSDSTILSQALNDCDQPTDVVRCIEKLQGPWSLVYYHVGQHFLFSIRSQFTLFFQAPTRKLFIGRDLFGRRSLLWARSREKILYISSVADERVGVKL